MENLSLSDTFTKKSDMIEITTNKDFIAALDSDAAQAKLSGPLATSYRKLLIGLELKGSKNYQIAILAGTFLAILALCLFPQLSPFDSVREIPRYCLPIGIMTIVGFCTIHAIGLLIQYRKSKLIIDLDTYRKARKINEKISPETPFSLERAIEIYKEYVKTLK